MAALRAARDAPTHSRLCWAPLTGTTPCGGCAVSYLLLLLQHSGTASGMAAVSLVTPGGLPTLL